MRIAFLAFALVACLGTGTFAGSPPRITTRTYHISPRITRQYTTVHQNGRSQHYSIRSYTSGHTTRSTVRRSH